MGKVYQNENQILLQQLIAIYNPNNYDWLSYQITKKNILTIHHILEQADHGKTTTENAALLTKKAHRILHMCESRDIVLYFEINDFFREIASHQVPLDQYYQNRSLEYKQILTRTLYK